jgi:hypothetical protein
MSYSLADRDADAAAARNPDADRYTYGDLYQHAIDALSSGNPAFQMNTPGWGDDVGGKHTATLEEVIGDKFAEQGDTVLPGLLTLLGLALISPDHAVRITAQKIAVDFAQDFSKFHGDRA